MTALRRAVVATVAASALLTGGVVAAPAFAGTAPPAPAATGLPTGDLQALILSAERLLQPGCLEATLEILLRQGGSPGPCL